MDKLGQIWKVPCLNLLKVDNKRHIYRKKTFVLFLVRFMVGWSEAICHMREPRQPLKASAPVEEVKVIYQFFYQNRARVLSESRPNPRCIWCDRLFKSVKDLLTHLKASHDKFTYSTPESKAIANGMKLTSVHIEVTKFNE